MGSPAHPVVATVGHGTASFTTVAELLANNGVELLVDVRSEPVSRWAPDFTRRRLEEECAAVGLGYRWMGDRLGGRPVRPPEVVEAGLADVLVLAATSPAALLCAEENPAACHRNLVLAPVLEDLGAHVIHLRHDGTAHPHQPPLL